MTAYMFLAPGFEETEAVTPLDLLRRAGIEVLTVGIGGKQITGAHGITLTADLDGSELTDPAADMVILPGGMPGTLNLDASELVQRALYAAKKNDSYICAICAAPRIPGRLGLLRGKRVTCYPGNEQYLEGATATGALTETDRRLITAKGPGAAVAFGLAIVSAALGKEAADRLAEAFIAP